MSLNLQAKDSYHVFDEYGMLIIPSDKSWEKRSWWKKIWDWILKREWIPTWSNKSWMDSLGRTVLAWIAYGRPKELHTGIALCLENTSIDEEKPKWELFRHPAHNELVSRDHMSYFIIHSFLLDKAWTINSFIPYIPSMRGLYLWMHSLTGNKRAERLYYLIYIPGALIGNIWLKFCRWTGRIIPEQDNEWWLTAGWYLQNNRTSWQKLWGRIINTTIPAYALHNKAWQLYVMPDSKRLATLCKVLLRRVGKSNIMLRLLFGDTTVTQQEVDAYPNMTNFRPGVYLDETCRRTIRELTAQEAEFNTYEKSLIQWLWKNNG